MKTPEDLGQALAMTVVTYFDRDDDEEFLENFTKDVATIITAERACAEAEIARWRSAFQECTPGGSEWTSPEAVREHMQRLKSETVEAKLNAVRQERRADKLAAALRELVQFAADAERLDFNEDRVLTWRAVWLERCRATLAEYDNDRR